MRREGGEGKGARAGGKWRVGRWADWASRPNTRKRGGEINIFLIFFQNKFSKSFSKRILKSFSDFVKTSHYKNKSAAA
jgi:hypothetical protein